MRLLTQADNLVGPWVATRTGGTWQPGRGTTIGLIHPHKGLVAGVLYEDWNGANVCMHVAAIPGRYWLNREFLWYAFFYPFVQLKVKRITGIVPSCNLDARKFDEKLGFELEAILSDAHPQGDLMVYRMTADKCRWLQLRKDK